MRQIVRSDARGPNRGHCDLRQHSVRVRVEIRPRGQPAGIDRLVAQPDHGNRRCDKRKLKNGMKPPAISTIANPPTPRAGRHHDSGCLAMVAIISMAALSIDVATLYLIGRRRSARRTRLPWLRPRSFAQWSDGRSGQRPG